MTGGGDERAGFRHVFQAPGLGLAAGAEHNGHPSQQSFGGLGILGVDFRLIGRAGAGRVILCRVHKRVAGGQTLDLLITQRAYGRTRRRFSFGCHGLYCGTDHRPTIPAQRSRERAAEPHLAPPPSETFPGMRRTIRGSPSAHTMRADGPPGKRSNHSTAMASISTSAPLGIMLLPKATRAGLTEPMNTSA